MRPEIYEALKARISVADEKARKAYCEEYPSAADAIVYRFDLGWIDDDPPCIIHAMRTKNIWNVAQRFYMFLGIYDDVDSKLLADRHVSCK